MQQALRDLSKWVEKGIAPAPSTNYKIVDGQVVIPETANERAGIQPTVDITINEKKRADVYEGETVTFTAVVEIPEEKGKLVHAAWDFDGSGTYKDAVDLTSVKIKNNGSYIEITAKHTFIKAGTFFPVLRVASQRDGDAETPFTKIQNLDRVRVVVNRQ